MLNRIYIWASRWKSYDRKVRGMLIQPASGQPGLVKGTVVLLENSITVRITEQHKRMEVITQQLYVPNYIEDGWYTHQRSKTVPRKNTTNHDGTTISLYSSNLAYRIHGHILSFPSVLSSRNRDSPLVSSPLHSSLCALLPRQDVQPDDEH
ncbi:hypothetical protein TNCV_14101 [Trichonephila clavipes]|nr:hypothetical protein TNCV_14101 [Trichonephila clavipes]